MREMTRHWAGRVFLLVLALSSAGMLYMTRYFESQVLILGWMTLPFAAGLLYMLVLLLAYLIYFFGYWPFRK
jgi:hypothetical protein